MREAIAAPGDALRDPELAHPRLRGLTIRREEPKGQNGALIEVARERLIYDEAGRLRLHEHLGPDGRLVVRTSYKFDERGRKLESHYLDHTGRTEIRTYTYKLDAEGRIAERALRNPASPAGELLRDVYTWGTDGSRAIRSYRQYAGGESYEDGSSSYDASGRLLRRCSREHCEMLEYDAHHEISRIREQSRGTHHYRVYENQYDAAGRLIRQRIGGSESSFRYDAAGRLVEERQRLALSPEARLTYEYDERPAKAR